MCICAYHLISICWCCPWICTSIATSRGGCANCANCKYESVHFWGKSRKSAPTTATWKYVDDNGDEGYSWILPTKIKHCNWVPVLRFFEIVIAFLPFWLQNHVCTLVRPPAVDIIDELQSDLLCGWYISLCYLPFYLPLYICLFFAKLVMAWIYDWTICFKIHHKTKITRKIFDQKWPIDHWPCSYYRQTVAPLRHQLFSL